MGKVRFEISSYEHNGLQYKLPSEPKRVLEPVRFALPPISGEDVARMRRWLGWSQRDAAQQLGCTERTIRNWERRPGELIGHTAYSHLVMKFLSVEKKIGGEWRGVYD